MRSLNPRGRRARRGVAAAGLLGSVAIALAAVGAPGIASARDQHGDAATTTPIKHVVVLFQENISFDHYFGTYPNAANTDGTPFHPASGTPGINGLTPALLDHNPNSANPVRLSHSEPLTCDQDHGYQAEQRAFDRGLMDKFVQYTDTEKCDAPDISKPGLVMDYYDGNTVTALWNYAQHYAMNDNSFGTTFGPSTPGALNLVAGQTHGVYSVDPVTGRKTPTPDPYTVADPNAKGIGTVINDPDPAFDDCSTTKFPRAAMTGANIGNRLNAKGVTWGWFQGGFRPTSTTDGTAVCGSTHTNVGGAPVGDYSAHHQPFQYYKSTANPHHLAPASVSEIGHAGRANHQYDVTDFSAALKAGNLPAVSFLKAGKYQDGHAGYSDPLDEQHFLVNTVNAIQKSNDWKSTAIVIAYDDSDGWYDHVAPPIINSSSSAANDAYTDTGVCGHGTPLGGYQDRCGYGPRLPLLVISPFSRVNSVDSTLTDQTSILRAIEDNWGTGRIGDGSFDTLAGPVTNMLDFSKPSAKQLLLDPTTGAPTHGRS